MDRRGRIPSGLMPWEANPSAMPEGVGRSRKPSTLVRLGSDARRRVTALNSSFIAGVIRCDAKARVARKGMICLRSPTFPSPSKIGKAPKEKIKVMPTGSMICLGKLGRKLLSASTRLAFRESMLNARLKKGSADERWISRITFIDSKNPCFIEEASRSFCAETRRRNGVKRIENPP